jgi:hypothetical protein
MKKLLDALIKMGSTSALIAASVVLPASSAKAVDVGGLNLDAYCRAFYGSNSRLISYNAGGWRCPTRNGLASIDTNAVCRWQYGKSYLRAETYNWSNPYSWRCVYGITRLIP